jgi:hypothetical protein
MKKNDQADIAKAFCKKHGLTEDQFYGKETVGGDLDLGSVTSLPDGFNPTVGGYLYLGSVTSLPDGFNPTVGGDLYLGSVTSLPDGFNPTVGGDLYLGSVTSLPDGFNPTVGGYLDLGSVTSLPDGFNPTVGGDLYLRSVTSLPDGFNPTVGGDLDLGSVTSLPDGFNPTVGGYLDLGSVTSLPDGFNPTVGGYLDLGSVTSLPDGFNPTVGGYLDLGSVTSLPDGFNPTVGGDLDLGSVTSLPDGFNPTVGGDLILKDSRKYIGANVPPVESVKEKMDFYWDKDGKRFAVVDGIFCQLLTEREHTTNGQTYSIFSAQRINKKEIFFVAKQGHYHAHGEDLRKAVEDLHFKINAEKIRKEPIGADTIISVQHYRIITGACELGCKQWMEQNGITNTEMKAKDLLPLLKKSNAYGFERFKSLVTF